MNDHTKTARGGDDTQVPTVSLSACGTSTGSHKQCSRIRGCDHAAVQRLCEQTPQNTRMHILEIRVRSHAHLQKRPNTIVDTHKAHAHAHPTQASRGQSLEDLTCQLMFAAVTTVVFSTSPHVPPPPHTPQMSIGTPAGQHCPLASMPPVQHWPRASMAMPLPSHTPHASTLPEPQHAPVASSAGLAPRQQSPVALMTVLQHVPPRSNTPAGMRSPVGDNGGNRSARYR